MQWNRHTDYSVIVMATEDTCSDVGDLPLAEDPFPLLDLPDPCLLAVVRCCEEPRTLRSAAMAHSRLRHAASIALSSSSACVHSQQQLGSLMQPLVNHPSHVGQLQVRGIGLNDQGRYFVPGCTLYISKLPANLRLHSLIITERINVQFHLAAATAGVLQPLRGSLTQLKLDTCALPDAGAGAGLAAALAFLPKLQRLSVMPHPRRFSSSSSPEDVKLPVRNLEPLQYLTCLELASVQVDLQHLTALTALQVLMLRLRNAASSATLTASVLDRMQQLTSLDLTGSFSPSCLAAVPQLRNLAIRDGISPRSAAGVTALLSHLLQMTQLTCLDLASCFEYSAPSAAAYSALTASSQLQRLEVACCGELPRDVWQQFVPVGRQLYHLTALQLDTRSWSSGDLLSHSPPISRFVSGWPGLPQLKLSDRGSAGAALTAEQLGPLTGLTCLTLLQTHTADRAGVGVILHLTGLRDLKCCRADCGCVLWCPSGMGCEQGSGMASAAAAHD